MGQNVVTVFSMSDLQKISLAPLQGFTDQVFRSCYSRHFCGVDRFYTPYFTADQAGKHPALQPEAALLLEPTGITIPQVLVSDPDELRILADKVVGAGFDSINLNLGCPYPMVMNRGRGASLIAKPEQVVLMIRYLYEYTSLKVSIKTRLGIDHPDEGLVLLEHLSPWPSTGIILHARTARQMYRGEVSTEAFIRCCKLFPQFDMVYNGDIVSWDSFRAISQNIPWQTSWMIGRGILQNPFLPWQIKQTTGTWPESHIDILFRFTADWIGQVVADSHDRGHALQRIQNQFSYLYRAFPDQQAVRRMVRKARSTDEILFRLDQLYRL